MDELLKQLAGQSVFAALVLGLMVTAGKWIANNIATPLKDAHIDYLKQSIETQKKQGETLETVSGCLEELKRRQDEHILICKGPPQLPGTQR